MNPLLPAQSSNEEKTTASDEVYEADIRPSDQISQQPRVIDSRYSPADSTGLGSPPSDYAPIRPISVEGPIAVPGGVQGGTLADPAQSAKKPSKRKLFVVLAAVFVGLMSSSAAAYLGYYQPNKPENLWGSALVNTGKGYDELVTYAGNTSSTKSWNYSGTFKTAGSMVADGKFEGKSSDKASQNTASISASGIKLDIDVRTLPSAVSTPDVYIKVNGLQGLGALLGGGQTDSALDKSLSGINNQWYVIDHTLFDQYLKGSSKDLQYTAKDVTDVLTAVGKSTKKYVFTSDTGKMVVKPTQNIGKEKLGGRDVYHYKVAVNKKNLDAYLNELCTDIKDTKYGKLISAKEADGKNQCEGLKDATKNVKDGDTADAWVDTRTKLVHKIRFTDKKNKANYFDIGQDYQGKAELPFSLAAHSASDGSTTDARLNMTFNKDTKIVKLDGSYGEKDKTADIQSGNLEMMIKPEKGLLTVQKPAGAKNLLELLAGLGLGDALNGLDTGSESATTEPEPAQNATMQSKSRDTERKTDLSSIRAQLEASYSETGSYPDIKSLNDPAWRAINMKSLSKEALKDPQGTDYFMSATVSPKVYAYSATTTGKTACKNSANDCQLYTLTATYEGGGTYELSSL